MRLRSSPLVLGALAIATTGSLALTTTTAFASSHHGSSGHNSTKIHGNCNVVGNNNDVHCTTISHSHRNHGGGGDFGFRHHGGILEGVGDVVGGLLGAL
jgi:hypothetical protein